MDEELFLAAVKAIVKVDEDWTPEAPGTSLYIRPFIISPEVSFSVLPAKRYWFIIILCAVGAYYEGNLTDENKARIKEFDFAVDQLENAFDNLECIDTSNLDIDQEYHLNKVISDEATLQAFKEFILGFMESSRNDYVISMLENQPDEE
jgi:hypothetical protein